MTGRYDWLRRIEQLDPARDYAEIYRITSSYEFPWDMTQSLGLALFRTYAVPTIGELLGTTREFTTRTQKRYDDTALILDAVLNGGFQSEHGRTAIRRMNQMHRSYDISNDDMRYVLSTFVVVPIRWLDAYGWRPMSETERVASANYYRELGRHMGIRDIPADYREFTTVLDEYEAAHFGFNQGGRAVADATLDLFTTFPLFKLLPAGLVRRFSYTLMDDPLLDAFRYPRPSRAARLLTNTGMGLRARIERLMPPRRRARLTSELPQIRSYPGGYQVAELGTFPAGCPVAHPTAAAEPAATAE